MASPTLSPASLAFGNQTVGTSSGDQTVKLTANSPGPLAISSISISAGFTESNNCPASLNPGTSCVTINSGTHANYTVTVSELGGSFNHNVSLSCSGLPAQSSCSFSPSGLTPGSGSAGSALTIKTSKANGTSGTQPGTYTITVTGNSNPLVHSTTVTLVVN